MPVIRYLCLIRDVFLLLCLGGIISDRTMGSLELYSVFPSAKIVAMTATATREYQKAITESLNMKNPSLVIANPDRANIFYEVIQRP